MSSTTPSKRVAIVTGAAGDLGKAIALRLADDGLHIAVNDLPARAADAEALAEKIRAKGVEALVVLADVSVEAEVIAMVADVVDKFGSLDVMVSNVGVFVVRPLLATSVEDWDHIMGTNARGMMLCYRTAAQQMIKQGRGGRIIGGCSIAGLTGAPLCAAYAASKFAVRGLTQVAAAELGQHNITVNAFAPGFIEGTAMVEQFSQGATEVLNLPPGAWMEEAKGLFKMPRLGRVEEVAGLVSYLASDVAAWTTGQTMAVDGGMHLA